MARFISEVRAFRSNTNRVLRGIASALIAGNDLTIVARDSFYVADYGPYLMRFLDGRDFVSSLLTSMNWCDRFEAYSDGNINSDALLSAVGQRPASRINRIGPKF